MEKIRSFIAIELNKTIKDEQMQQPGEDVAQQPTVGKHAGDDATQAFAYLVKPRRRLTQPQVRDQLPSPVAKKTKGHRPD